MINSTPSPETTPSPVRPAARITLVDAIRGFALFGVLLANMASFQGRSIDPNAWTEPLDQALVIFHRFLVEAKFYSLFSFLFGWGAALQWRRAEKRGGRFPRIYARRMVILLVMGLAHAFLLWRGDILAHYALFGLLLVLFRKRSSRTLLAAGAASLLLSVVLTLPGGGLDAFREAYANLTAPLRSEVLSDSLYGFGSYGEITRLRIQDYLAASSWMLYYFGNVFAMFLVGLYAGRRRLFSDLDAQLPLFKKLLIAGLAVGLPLNGLHTWTLANPGWPPPGTYRLFTTGARTLGAPALTMAYVAAFALLSRRERWARRLALLAPVGRMALTNYLTHSVLGTLIFYGYGLGLYGSTDPTFGMILTLLIFVAQIRFSAWWLERYRYGPMEWLWRSFTYGHRQPIRPGETLPAARPPRRSRLRRWLRDVHPLVPLAIVWTLLLVWAAALWAWHQRLEAGDRPEVVQVVVQITATPAPGEEGTSGSGTTPEESLPSVPEGEMPAPEPVTYRPGSLAASGDMGAMARAFDVRAALAEIETLADPSFGGRYAGSPGGQAAAEYIAGKFESYRLRPAGQDGSYYQPFPVTYTPLAEEPQLSVTGPDGRQTTTFTLYQDYAPVVRMYAGQGQGSGEVVWADDCQPEDFAGLDAVGKVVFCEAGSFGSTPHLAGRAALEHGAAGLLLLTDPEERPPGFGDIYAETWVPETLPSMRVYPPVADHLLSGTGMTSDDLGGDLEPFPLLTHVDMSVSLAAACPAAGCQARNVLGVLPGRDPAHADQVVILSGHYDHLGAGPEGTVWAGANDNASGIAVLLEIARLWAEQGYVPRRTVVFAAWDAEEAGLLGSRYYVDHPTLPLTDTVAVLALDMVGAGDETLKLDGSDGVAGRVLAAAEALDVPVERLSLGRSDHVPFLEAGVPAGLLIWWDEENPLPHYHRPQDVPAVIEPDRLGAAGRLAGAALLDLAESEPALFDLIADRARALNRDDLAAFLDTATPEKEASDRAWFADRGRNFPGEVSLSVANLRIRDDRATALLQIEVAPADPGAASEAPSASATLPALFLRRKGVWQFAGPNLVTPGTTAGEPGLEPAPMAIAHAPALEHDWTALAREVAAQYASQAGLLGLPTESQGALQLFAQARDLRGATALSLPEDQTVWAERGTLKLVYTAEITHSRPLRDGLAGLLLAVNGVKREAAPWLWEGLPLVLEAHRDPVGVQRRWLPELQAALAKPDPGGGPVFSWAATQFLQEKLGWGGLGAFIADLGEWCQAGSCRDGTGMTAVLRAHLDRDPADFEDLWRGHWESRLVRIQAGLDAAGAARESAVLSGDLAGFLATVDPEIPHLLAEERAWFEALTDEPLADYRLQASPLAVLTDGRILARSTIKLQFEDGRERQHAIESLYTLRGDVYRWAGPFFQVLEAGPVTLRYQTATPASKAGVEGELAQGLLDLARDLAPQVEATLGLGADVPLTLSLYNNEEAFRASIAPDLPAGGGVRAWHGPGESLRLLVSPASGVEAHRSTLVEYLLRRLLAENGVRTEWLLKGLSLYLARPFDGGGASARAAALLPDLQNLAVEGRLLNLATLPADHLLSPQRVALIRAMAWDSARYLVEDRGWPAVQRLIDEGQTGGSLEAAFARALGTSLESFQTRWEASLAGGHLEPAWAEMAGAFDRDQAMAHVSALTAPELAGREAGTGGEGLAADYLSEQFAAYGLQPIGDDPTQPFQQTFAITRTAPVAPPRLEFWFSETENLVPLLHREDFLVRRPGFLSAGPVSGELVWVSDPGDPDLDLGGKIAILRPERPVDEEASRAASRGALGLILVGTRREPEEVLGKAPWITLPDAGPGIPVLELTRDGYVRFLEAGELDSQDLHTAAGAQAVGATVYMDFRLQAPRRAESANVLGLLPGADPYLAGEVIILGAHYDHVGDDPPALVCPWQVDGHPVSNVCRRIPGRRYSGENDDASGVAVLLEIARSWQENGYRPARSVLFAAWGAQEPGQLGSAHYLANPTVPLTATVAVIQLDGMGGGEGFNLGVQAVPSVDGLPHFAFTVASAAFEEKLITTDPLTPSDHWTFQGAGPPVLLAHWRLANEANLPDGVANAVHPDRLEIAGRVVSLALLALTQ